MRKRYFDNGEREESFRYPDSVVCPPHVHPLVEAVFVTEGSIVSTVNGEAHTVNAGDAIIIPPNHFHGYISQTKQRLYIFVFFLEDYPELESIARIESPVVKNIVTPQLIELMRISKELYNRPDCPKMVKHSLISSILSEALAHCSFRKTDNISNTRGLEIYNYCLQHYRDDIRLKDVADAINISEGHLSMTFSKKFNISFNDYINMLRVNEAKPLLTETDQSVTVIATKCGFNTVRSFNRAFLKQVGTTPLNYRKTETQREYVP